MNLFNPPVLKVLRRVTFGTGSKFGTEVAKRYGEGLQMLVFLGKKRQKWVQIVKNYGGIKYYGFGRRIISGKEGYFGKEIPWCFECFQLVFCIFQWF